MASGPRHGAASRRLDADGARFRAKTRAVIERLAGFILPLMHHLMQERLEGFLPSVPPQVPPADGDLPARLGSCRGVVPEPAAHATGHANRDGLEASVEMLGVELAMQMRELRGQRLILGSRALAPNGPTWRLYTVRNDPLLRGAALAARAALDKGHDGSMDLVGRNQVALVNAQLVAAETYHDVSVARQTTPGNPTQSIPTQPRQQLVGVARRRVHVERELGGVAAAPERRSQRAKHFTGPATKFWFSSDHSSVDTSISLSVIRMLFTDDGRPPLDRLLMVPAVDTIVPRLVCSM